jgi:crossover junction endodeoxyribonuclease RuvC
MTIEAPFFGKNVQSMLKLGRAQGVAMAAGLSRDIPITEYEPKKIKMAITGNGMLLKSRLPNATATFRAEKLLKKIVQTDGSSFVIFSILEK